MDLRIGEVTIQDRNTRKALTKERRSRLWGLGPKSEPVVNKIASSAQIPFLQVYNTPEKEDLEAWLDLCAAQARAEKHEDPAPFALVKVSSIQGLVCKRYGVDLVDLCSARRKANLVHARHIAIFLAKKLTLKSLPEIGRLFGGRDHTTVLHSIRKVENMISIDTEFAEEVESLRRQLLR